MKYSKKVLFIYAVISFFTMFSFLILINKKVSAYDNKKNILIINSYHRGYKWSDDIIFAFESILNTSDFDIDVEIEYMDTLRTSGEELTNKLFEIYKYKYANKKLDAVVCCDDAAYNFVLNSQGDLFPNTPIVFCGVNDFDSSKIEGNETK